MVNLRRFIGLLGLPAEGGIGIDDVNWNRTFIYTNTIMNASTVCQVRFNNNVCFESLNGVVFSYFSKDACYTGVWDRRTSQEWISFNGQVMKRWEDLSQGLREVLTEKLGIREDLLDLWSPMPAVEPPKPGKEGVARAFVEWRNWPKNPGKTVWVSETKLGYAAEFDLVTGELKWIDFYDLRLIKELANQQREIIQ